MGGEAKQSTCVRSRADESECSTWRLVHGHYYHCNILILLLMPLVLIILIVLVLLVLQGLSAALGEPRVDYPDLNRIENRAQNAKYIISLTRAEPLRRPSPNPSPSAILDSLSDRDVQMKSPASLKQLVPAPLQ